MALEHPGEPLRRSWGVQAQSRAPASSALSHIQSGFSTLAQLKRRNALKDGIIMIQTTLIILFITVPIFLLLDKVTLGGREATMGQGLHLPSPEFAR